MKFLILGSFFFFSMFTSAQIIISDTLYPYSILKDDAPGKFQVLFSNSNMAYFFSGKQNYDLIQRAIKNSSPISFQFNESTQLMKKIRMIKYSDKEKFLDLYDTLQFENFKYNGEISFEQNEKLLDLEVINLELPLNNITTTDSAELIFNLFLEKSCKTVDQCENENICISDDYKVNGCNARAHWMKKIMNEEFGLDCKKIFSEGKLIAINDGNCGGKCVFWGWHVAVLLYVKDASGKINELILDPSLFSKPVTKEEWILSQESICPTNSKKGKVKTVAIRPSFVYTPNGSSDPDYNDSKRLLKKFCSKCH